MKLSDVVAGTKLSELPPEASDDTSVMAEAGRGLARGALGNVETALSGASVMALGSEYGINPIDPDLFKQVTLTPAQAREQTEKVTGKIRDPETAGGKIIESATSFATNPLSYIGGGASIPAKAGMAALTGAGSEAAGQAVEGMGGGKTAADAARLVGSFATPSRTVTKLAGKAVGKGEAAGGLKYSDPRSTSEILTEAAVKDYENPIIKDQRYYTRNVAPWGEELARRFQIEGGGDQFAEPKVFNLLKMFGEENLAAKTNVKDLISFENLNNIKRKFLDAAKDRSWSPQEQRGARLIAGWLDEKLETTRPSVRSKSAKTDDEALSLIKNANANYRAAQSIADLENMVFNAYQRAKRTGLGANEYNVLRQDAGKLARSKDGQKYLDKDTLADLLAIERGGPVGHLMNVFAKLGPEHPLTGWGSALAADFAGGSGVAIASMGLGKLAQTLAPKIVMRKIHQIQEGILEGAPAGEEAIAVRGEQKAERSVDRKAHTIRRAGPALTREQDDEQAAP